MLNYADEVMSLGMFQLLWSRFVNVHGLPGHNIAGDLHMEHLNHINFSSNLFKGLELKKEKPSQGH